MMGAGYVDQLANVLLIDWWRGDRVLFWEAESSVLQFQPVLGLRSGGHHAVNFFYLARGWG